jgi:hypothetical protein
MANFKQCRECVNASYSRNCPFDKLHREVQNYFITKGEYDCKSFEQKPLPPPRMTEEQYQEKQGEILADIPVEFHSTLSYMAYERGHSSGYEECIGIRQDLVTNLEPAIDSYRNTLIKHLGIS